MINKSLVDFGLTCGKVILKQSQGVFLRGGYHQGVIEILGFLRDGLFMPSPTERDKSAFVDEHIPYFEPAPTKKKRR